MTAGLEDCHRDCGPVVARAEGQHAHDNVDGRCWHDDDDGVAPVEVGEACQQ